MVDLDLCGRSRSRNRCGGGEGVWEKDLTTSTKFGWLKQLKLGVEMVEMGWEERGGRDESGRGKVSSIMRVVGGLAALWHAPEYLSRTNKVVRH